MRDCLRVEVMRDVVVVVMIKFGCFNECMYVVVYSMGVCIVFIFDELSLKFIVFIGGFSGLCGEDARVARVV